MKSRTVKHIRPKWAGLQGDSERNVCRRYCCRCLQPEFGCLCPHIRAFDPLIKFVILTHPIERRRRFATGRLTYLSLKNSEIFYGHDFTSHPGVNAILSREDLTPYVLYPGDDSKNLTYLSLEERKGLFPSGKKLAVFVIDGTWSTARQMLRLSKNIQSLPRMMFTPSRPSQFKIRRQPNQNCYSTAESVVTVVDCLGEAVGFDVSKGEHRSILETFEKMVGPQAELIESLNNPYDSISSLS